MKLMKRPCILQNIYSGRVIKAKSITEFCKRARLTKISKYHITPVLDGKRPMHKNWATPIYLDKKLSLKDIYGNKYDAVSVREILRKNIISPCGIKRLIKDNKKTFQGISLSSTQYTPEIAPKNYKITKWSFQKSNKIIEGSKLTDLGAKMGVNISNLYPVIYGFKDQIKGIKLRSVTVEKKKAINNLNIS